MSRSEPHLYAQGDGGENVLGAMWPRATKAPRKRVCSSLMRSCSSSTVICTGAQHLAWGSGQCSNSVILLRAHTSSRVCHQADRLPQNVPTVPLEIISAAASLSLCLTCQQQRRLFKRMKWVDLRVHAHLVGSQLGVAVNDGLHQLSCKERSVIGLRLLHDMAL